MIKRDLNKIPKGTCVCSVCKVEQDNLEYQWYKTRFTSNGYRLRVNTNCKDCSKRISKELRKLKKKLTASHPQPKYGEPCDLCGNPVYKNWQLDHCHDTGEFRGWLCKGCNTGLGSIGDTFESVVNALKYINRFEDKPVNDIVKLISE